MSDLFYRVKATVTMTGEWFVKINERVKTPEDAMKYVRLEAGMEEPENVLESHAAYILPSEVWVADDRGERVVTDESGVTK